MQDINDAYERMLEERREVSLRHRPGVAEGVTVGAALRAAPAAPRRGGSTSQAETHAQLNLPAACGQRPDRCRSRSTSGCRSARRSWCIEDVERLDAELQARVPTPRPKPLWRPRSSVKMPGPRATLRGASPNGCDGSVGIVTRVAVEVVVDGLRASAVDVADDVGPVGRRAAHGERRRRRVRQVHRQAARHRVDGRHAPAADDPLERSGAGRSPSGDPGRTAAPRRPWSCC